MLFKTFLLFFIFCPILTEMVRFTNHHARRHMSSSLEFTANVVYNKLYQRSLNINNTRVVHIEPEKKVWFAIENGTLYALPLFGDTYGPFEIQFENPNSMKMKLKFDFAPSSSLFSPSDHLLLALFNLSSTNYNSSLLNRYYVVRTLSLALNLSESLITIHKINGSMIKVYFSCDLYSTKDLAYQIKTLINYYYLKRLQLLSSFPLPLLEISILRLSHPTTTTIGMFEMKKAVMTIQPRLLTNRTLSPPINNLIFLDQLYQPLVIVPLAIILIGLFICTIIAFCLCCNRRSSSSSTLLLPSGPSGSPNNKYLYDNYSYRKHRQQQEIYRKKHSLKDQKQYISKGIPVVFAEELEEKLEQTHTPLVMRIEKASFTNDQEGNGTEKMTL
ncbi:hypothetical protein I4U23_012568 [Adineta vaga]|nr:hypothetical protein I4U23_012568 [Adineta vaga]